MIHHNTVVIITGPTASGKTGFSYGLAAEIDGEIINADIAQCYTSVSIGTAKPDWRAHQVPAHLFDILDTPTNFNAAQYRKSAFATADEILARGKTPIFVGGSMFYLQSLFYPPSVLDEAMTKGVKNAENPPLTWQELHAVDPVRAAEIHPNDSYRIMRAMEIWRSTGRLPSELKPSYSFPYKVLLIGLRPDKVILRSVIAQRCREMLHAGWWQEAACLIGSTWEEFVVQKGFIGYDILFQAIKASVGCHSEAEAEIVLQTTQYAKRQITFLDGMLRKLAQEPIGSRAVLVFDRIDEQSLQAAQDCFHLLEKKPT